jgi:hypothetical protein
MYVMYARTPCIFRIWTLINLLAKKQRMSLPTRHPINFYPADQNRCLPVNFDRGGVSPNFLYTWCRRRSRRLQHNTRHVTASISYRESAVTFTDIYRGSSESDARLRDEVIVKSSLLLRFCRGRKRYNFMPRRVLSDMRAE